MDFNPHLLQVFFPQATLNHVAPIGNGNINDTFILTFSQKNQTQSVLFQRLNHLVFTQPYTVMDNIRMVCHHLEQTPYPFRIPTPIPTAEGQFLHHDPQGNYWRCLPFFHHTYTPEGLSDSHTAFHAAKAYGLFSKALQDFPPNKLAETIPDFHHPVMRWNAFLKTIRENKIDRNDLAKPEIQRILDAQPVFEAIARLQQAGYLPLRVVHNDTKAGNILFDMDSRKPVAVIDLDTVMPGTILSDFGDMVRTFSPDKDENATDTPALREEIIMALLEGFLSETAEFLTPEERAHLLLGGAWIIAEQALRFLNDWLQGDVYYKVTDADHNLRRTRNQLALLDTLLQWPEGTFKGQKMSLK